MVQKAFLYFLKRKFQSGSCLLGSREYQLSEKKKLKGNCLKENDLKDFSNPNTEDYNAIEETLKGKELKLPDEIFF